MTQTGWQYLTRMTGIQSEILSGLLGANGIPTISMQEGAGKTIGLGIGPLAEVEILVPKAQFDEAQVLLAAFEEGSLPMTEEGDSQG
ncbi:MAG: hypothetical protein Fur0018_03680 [Anaerolineales bacterium]